MRFRRHQLLLQLLDLPLEHAYLPHLRPAVDTGLAAKPDVEPVHAEWL
jgi:hypothetical protein